MKSARVTQAPSSQGLRDTWGANITEFNNLVGVSVKMIYHLLAHDTKNVYIPHAGLVHWKCPQRALLPPPCKEVLFRCCQQQDGISKERVEQVGRSSMCQLEVCVTL